MENTFSNSTYLSQVRKLRILAIKALKQYSIGAYKLDFINHGENTTFKVTTKNNKYLLRIHRHGYHTKHALLEELSWLKSLSKQTDIPVQRPVLSKNQKSLIKVFTEDVEAERYCDLLHWQEGQIKYKKSDKIFFEVGLLTAKIQTSAIKSKHRHYWDAEGLLGNNATLGSLSQIRNEFKKEFNIINPYRKMALKKLQEYQIQNPHKLSLIHADLHFGNMLWRQGIIHPIDFDDCGYGLQMYDLAVILISSRNYLKKIGKKKAYRTREALFDGYASLSNLSVQDIEILPYLILAREIAMIGWLYERRDNPQLLDYMIKDFPRKIKRIRNYHLYLD